MKQSLHALAGLAALLLSRYLFELVDPKLRIELFIACLAGGLVGLFPLFLGKKYGLEKMAYQWFFACLICGAILGLLLATPVAIIGCFVLSRKFKSLGNENEENSRPVVRNIEEEANKPPIRPRPRPQPPAKFESFVSPTAPGQTGPKADLPQSASAYQLQIPIVRLSQHQPLTTPEGVVSVKKLFNWWLIIVIIPACILLARILFVLKEMIFPAQFIDMYPSFSYLPEVLAWTSCPILMIATWPRCHYHFFLDGKPWFRMKSVYGSIQWLSWEGEKLGKLSRGALGWVAKDVNGTPVLKSYQQFPKITREILKDSRGIPIGQIDRDERIILTLNGKATKHGRQMAIATAFMISFREPSIFRIY